MGLSENRLPLNRCIIYLISYIFSGPAATWGLPQSRQTSKPQAESEWKMSAIHENQTTWKILLAMFDDRMVFGFESFKF